MSKKNINTIIYLNKEFLGVKKHSIFNSQLICYEIPGDKFSYFANNINEYNDLLKNAGIYFLIDSKTSHLYIGQSRSINDRIFQHIKSEEKNFDKIVFFVSSLNEFNQMIIDYLEWFFINETLVRSTGYSLSNKNERKNEPLNISEIDKINLFEIIEQMRFILLSIGIDYYSKVIDVNSKESSNDSEIFRYCDGYLVYKLSKFILLKNSIIKDVEKKNLKWADADRLNESKLRNESTIEKLKNENLISWNGQDYVAEQDIILNSPSIAAVLVSNLLTANGWICWKNNKNKTLDDVYRK